MMARKIGITGGAGFVGTHLALAAERAGYELTLYDIGDRMGRLSATGLANRARRRYANLADTGRELDEDLDLVVHLAALPQVDYSLYHPELVVRNNVNSTLTVLKSARAYGYPVLFGSSIEVYGGNGGERLIEESPVLPLSPYASSKIACENLVSSYRSTFGVTATTFRLTNLYGPFQVPDRVIPRVTVQSILGMRSEAVSGRYRDFLHISDAVDGIMALIGQRVWGETFNISGGLPLSLEQVVEAIVGPDGYDLVDPADVDGRGPHLVADAQKLTAATDWRPTIDWRVGVRNTVAWYRKQRLWWDPLNGLAKASRSGPDFLADHVCPISGDE
jgi:dTDP-glucose 4,6-dehydratase